ncbi:MAG: hypothetical protein HZB38_13955 [Planctomycetes bacterium]|nr:hypothetical protein [Planctomycetota bacterium]
MKRSHLVRRMALLAAGAALLQFTACFGPDPQFFVTSSITNALIANLVSLLFNTVTAGLAA